MKVPAILTTGLICLVAGVGLGALGMANADLVMPPKTKTVTTVGPDGAPPSLTPRAPAPAPAGPPAGPSPTAQLVTLVTKLDQLTQKPLTVTLTDDERARLAEQLKDLDGPTPAGDEECKKRLDAILEIVKEDREALEAAGFRWPGDTRIPPRGGAPNPFTEVDKAPHLKALRERLAKPKGD
jgi:hypothetical protein